MIIQGFFVAAKRRLFAFGADHFLATVETVRADVMTQMNLTSYRLNSQARRGQCIYLVDDLPSELDEQHRRALCRLLEDLRCQVFITCVDHELLREGWQTETPVALFHVEQGRITQTHDHRE